MMEQTETQLTCKNCGTDNAANRQFCVRCGYALASTSADLPSKASTALSDVNATERRRTTGALTSDSLLGGRYRIIQLMGKGGFGAVYKANDERFQALRVVAIKEMSDASLNPVERVQALEDFRREANLLVQLSHTNLPTVSDFFEEEGKAYLVMDFIEGKTLEKIQDEAHSPLDEKVVMGWALQLCEVLHYLHSRPHPIIFRDMKPSNVMVTTDNQIKLIDFGIARIFKVTATKDTTLLGSQGYAPLEQYGRGQSDPRSDIYALGATLYHLLTGSVPLDAPSRRINPQIFEPPHQLNPRLSEATETIILMAMEQDPDERFQSAEAMRNALLAEAGMQPPSTSSTSKTFAKAPSPRYPSPASLPPTTAPHEATSSTKYTFEHTILPLVIDIGSSIYRAMQENSSRRTVSHIGAMQQPPIPPASAARPVQSMAPLAPPPRSESGIHKGLRQIENFFVAIINVISHLLGLISTVFLLLLVTRFVLTFFHVSLGEFSFLITTLSTPLVAPFGNLVLLFHASPTTSYTVDVSALVAFVVYSLGFGLIRSLLKLLTKREK